MRFGYAKLDQLRGELLLDPLREDPRFLAAFDDPELLAAHQELVLPGPLVALRATAGHWDEIDFELYDMFEPEEETRSWLTACTGNDAPPLVEDLRVFGQDGTGVALVARTRRRLEVR